MTRTKGGIGTKRLWVVMAATVVGVSAWTLPAQAGDRDFRDQRHEREDERGRGDRFRGYDRDDRHEQRDHDRHNGGDRHDHGRFHIQPVYRTVYEKVWVEPVYRTEIQRVYREPVYQDVVDRVWVPDRYEVRVYEHVDQHGCRTYQKRRVLIQKGHFVEQVRRVEVKPGCWEEVPHTVCVSEGHWKTIERRELVRGVHLGHGHQAHRRHDPDGKFELDLSIDF